jgi:hypothetical protein
MRDILMVLDCLTVLCLILVTSFLFMLALLAILD